MRFVKFLFALLLTIGFIFILNTPLRTSKAALPPIGKLLSPFEGFWQNAEKSSPSLQKSIHDPTLSAPVTVKYDDRMVPHIFAQTSADAYFAQGYVTASQRLWQMEFQTLATAGRLSEILGENPEILDVDKRMRRKGLAFAAENALKEWQKHPELYAYIEAYSKGVNAYIHSLSPAKYPLEYKLLNYAPEDWTPLHTALLMKYMALDLAGRNDDIGHSNVMTAFKTADYDFLYKNSAYFKEQKPVIPDSSWNFNPAPISDEPSNTPNVKGKATSAVWDDQPAEGIGSNNWAVSGKRTASGKPILCNDPHLSLNLPSIWFEVQITTPEYNVYGVSLPGAPAVIIGFNKNIAWGITNVGHEVSDIMQVRWKDASKMEYLYDSTYMPVQLRIETIKVKGGKNRIDTVRYTHLGPVFKENKNSTEGDLLLHWLAHEGSIDPETFLLLNKAKNYEDYKNAIRNFTCPASNFVFASNTGDIALWVQGKFPLQKRNQGTSIDDGSVSKNTWRYYIPQEHNPHQYNPARGFVSSANQHSTNPSYPYFYHSGSFEEYRGRYLNTQLEKIEKATAKEMMALQNDNYNLKAAELLPLMLKISNLQEETAEPLKKWDFVHTKEALAPILFDIWYRKTMELSFDELLPLVKQEKEVLYPTATRLWYLLRDSSAHSLFDIQGTAEKETAKEVLIKAWDETKKEIAAWTKTNTDALIWKNYQNHGVRHLLPTLKAFSVEKLDVGGDKSALNAMGSRQRALSRNTTGPSWRMIVELGDKPHAYGVYPGGQSGNPGSPYYLYNLEKWVKGEYFELVYLMNEEEKNERVKFTQGFGK